MNSERGFVKYLLVIIVILAVVFLSQQAYSRGFGKTLVSDATKKAQTYLAEGSNWAMSKIYPPISGAVQKRGDIIKNEVNQEKQKVSENIGTKIKNYFSGIADSVLHPGQNNSCQGQPAQPAPAK